MTEKYKFDITIIGAGVLGLATAREFARLGKSVVLVEKNSVPGSETTSRNSEVVHAGIYYRTGSLKHQLCITGNPMIYEHCEKYNIQFNKCGKVIFSKDDSTKLDEIFKIGQQNGVELAWKGQHFLNQFNNICTMERGFFSPTTGIIDSHNFVKSLEGLFEQNSGTVSYNTKVLSIMNSASGIETQCVTGNDYFVLESKAVINTTGHNALGILNTLTCEKNSYQDLYVKGHYFSYSENFATNHLLYPIPSDLGLGVHLTIDISGNIRFGPDTVQVKKSDDYTCLVTKSEFQAQVLENFPKINPDKLNFSYCGVRPKILMNNKVCDDFIFHKSAEGKMLSALGYESPGLTACLSAANYITHTMKDITA